MKRFKEAIYSLSKSMETKTDEDTVHILKWRALCYEGLEEYDMAFNNFNLSYYFYKNKEILLMLHT